MSGNKLPLMPSNRLDWQTRNAYSQGRQLTNGYGPIAPSTRRLRRLLERIKRKEAKQ